MLISWDELFYFAVPTILLVLLGGWAAYKDTVLKKCVSSIYSNLESQFINQ